MHVWKQHALPLIFRLQSIPGAAGPQRVALLLLILYFVVGMLWFTLDIDSINYPTKTPVIDAFYFTVVTLTTVGLVTALLLCVPPLALPSNLNACARAWVPIRACFGFVPHAVVCQVVGSSLNFLSFFLA